MRINNNSWNRIRYTLYTPIYDLVGRYFQTSRRISVESLDIKSNDKVLLVGAGTELDLEFIPDDCSVVLTDITPAMLEKVQKRNKKLKKNIEVRVMDGQALAFANESFDKIILHLILAVIPDPVACIIESERVLKRGGKLAVFDKFVRPDKKVGFLRRFFNIITNALFSDITRDFESLHLKTGLKIISDEDAEFKGNFRRILLLKD